MRKVIRLAWLIVLALLAGCATKEAEQADVVAKVNESYITNGFLDEASSDQKSDEVRAALKRKIMEK